MRQIAKSILLRLTAEEYAHLKATADAAGLKLEPMLRQLILGVELRPRPPDEYAALLRELSAIGNNVNQIAYWANARKYISNSEIQEAATLVRKAFALVKEAL
jgi:ribbon-helix-helix protein, copG family